MGADTRQMRILLRSAISLVALTLISAGCLYGPRNEQSSPPASLPFGEETGADADGQNTDGQSPDGEDAEAVDSEGTTTIVGTDATTPDGEPAGPDQPVSEITEPTRPAVPTPGETTIPLETTTTTETTGETPSTGSPSTESTTTIAVPPTTTTATTTTSAPTTTPVPTTDAPSTIAPTTALPPTTAAPTTTAPAGPTLVWADEFDSFDSDRWKKEHSTYGDGNNELQCYTPEQVTVSGGSLVLRAETRSETCPNGSTRAVTSGMVRSQGVTFSPGQRIVYRVKLTPDDEANQGGLWPAFWSSGWAGGGWPNGGEWDGFEVMTARSPKRSVFSLHYANSLSAHQKTSKEIYADENFSAAWHEMSFDYGLDGTMVWRMDGVVVHTVSDADTKQGWPAPFDQAMTELKINLALGGSPGPLDPLALPATYQVDYVRIYDLP